MKVGDLVKWIGKDLGIILELDEPNAFDPVDRVLVYFFDDEGSSMIRADDLEVICK
tara:strand:+ start:2053 stop:2220 length:168 start_codon:yes stop_codon:yes gene_type:complete